MADAEIAAACPHRPDQDERKSATFGASRVKLEPGTVTVQSFALAREVLRSRLMRQAMSEREMSRFKGDRMPVFFLEGEAHRRKRKATARYFTPKAVATRHRVVMERATERLIGQLRASGEGRLDDLSLELAVEVAAEIVGLTDSDQKAMGVRVDRMLANDRPAPAGAIARFLRGLLLGWRSLNFYLRDVKPAIRARRGARQDDVISHLLDEGYSDQEILVECMTYASAGMITTREFIVMAAWHMFDREELRQRFLTSDEDRQLAILDEILRLEPIASRLFRRTLEEIDLPELGKVPAGTLIAIDVYAANVDEAVAGKCPLAIDPDRKPEGRAAGPMLSFGEGHHHCPGWQVAMYETRVFLDRMMRLPGIRLARAPDVGWAASTMSYELRNAIVACDPG